MKYLFALLILFASCKVTHVVKCECRGKVDPPFNPFIPGAEMPNPNYLPNWFYPKGRIEIDTLTNWSGLVLDTTLPLRQGAKYINNADTASWGLRTETYYRIGSSYSYDSLKLSKKQKQ